MIEFLTENFVAISQIVTTCALVFLTWRLAIATRMMAEAMAKPEVVVQLEPNQWSKAKFLDLVVSNTGTSSAFHVTVRSYPEITQHKSRESMGKSQPFSEITVLRPGQIVRSFISEWSDIENQEYEFIVKWRRSPAGRTETVKYRFDVEQMRATTTLNDDNPLVRISRSIENLRQDWQQVARGARRIGSNVYDSDDRSAELKALEDEFDRVQEKENSK